MDIYEAYDAFEMPDGYPFSRMTTRIQYNQPALPGGDMGMFPAAHPRPFFKVNDNDMVYIKSTTTSDLSYWLRQARDNHTALKVVKVDESASPFQVAAELSFADGERIRARFAIDELEPEAETLDASYDAWLDVLSYCDAAHESGLRLAAEMKRNRWIYDILQDGAR